MVSLRAGKIVFLGMTCGLLLAAFDVSRLIEARQSELEAAAHCAICGMARQAELEFSRLEQKISAALAPMSATGPEDVRLRYDALAERVAALDGPAFRDFTGSDPESAATVRRLSAVTADLDPIIGRIAEPGTGAAALAEMAPLDFELTRLAAAADRAGEGRAAAGQAELGRLYQVFSRVLVGLFAFGAALLLLVAWHNRQLGLARDGLHGLTRKLQSASAGLETANAQVTAVNVQLQARNEILGRRDREMGLQNQRFDAALNNMPAALCMVNADHRLVIYNQRFADLFGLDFGPVAGVLFTDLVALAGSPHLKQVHARQRALPRDSGTLTFVQDLADDRTLSVTHRTMPEGGWVATYEDISQRRHAEAQIAYLAHHDTLTGLVNRSYFTQQLGLVAAEAAARGGRVAVHCLDIDGFREINDAFGHSAGDALLREVGRRLAATARAGDLVARLGGDQFAVLQRDSPDADGDAALAARLIEAIAERVVLPGGEVSVSASAGLAVAPADGLEADELVRNANLALASAKGQGGGLARVFAPDMDAARRARRLFEADLRRALPNGEIEVYFQPLVDARRVAITGFEALARWRHPERGMVPPAEFIPVAEDLGLIGEIGGFMLGQACTHAARWPRDLTVAVNLSPAQFGSPTLLAAVEEALRASGLSPTRLEVEITESVLLDDGEGTLETLHALRDRGIRIAMDDFGTGYSSLSYLRRFPFDKIKIDQSFVRELSSRPDCVKIVRSIAALGASLGMTTTAEGVETAEQFRQLQEAGCDQVQGFHFGRPTPASDISFTLAATPPVPDARAA